MDLTLYKTLLEVAKWHNYTKAGEHLGYAQSSVTTQIQSLRKCCVSIRSITP
ncbi:LysR family transcriptional regulator [Paenibacillus sp. N3.4]|nr:LysR family transcriptional regulator [Paenibacillus sp. N3.4]